MTRRKKLAVAGITVALALACAFVAFLFLSGERNPAISEESYQKIRIGMTEDQVLQVMASPPGHYSTSTVYSDTDDVLFHLPAKSPARVISWTGTRWAIILWLDEKNVVTGKRFVRI